MSTTPSQINHDLGMAAACERMERVGEIVHVSASECKMWMRRNGYTNEAIALLFKDGAPARVQMRSTMLVVRQ